MEGRERNGKTGRAREEEGEGIKHDYQDEKRDLKKVGMQEQFKH